MKITKLSLAAIATVAMTTGAMADIDLKTGGQAVVYYQTNEHGGTTTLFDQDNSIANFGLQLNVNGDLGNDFGLGLQGTGLSTLGLEDNLVSNVMQSGLANNGDTANASNYFAITKAYLTKKIANTTLKMGRQELPKSLSPLAFSESWNVYKNTFDAVVAINSDIQDTTIVGAYVDRANTHGDFSTFGNFTTGAGGAVVHPDNAAYMLTAQNKSLDGLTLTGSYYSIPKGTATAGTPQVDAYWLDAQADLNTLTALPVKVGVQGGRLSPDGAGLNDTDAAGIKVSGKASNVNLSLAYTKTGGGTLSVQNVGTGVKTPLYTQMILNQNDIARSADTTLLKAAMPLADGKAIAQYGLTQDNAHNNSDYNELDLIYKFKALGTDMLAAYVRTDADDATDASNIVRFWTRYNF